MTNAQNVSLGRPLRRRKGENISSPCLHTACYFTFIFFTADHAEYKIFPLPLPL